MDQHGLFYVFLNNEAVMFHLVVIGWVRLFVLSFVLIQLFLRIFIYILILLLLVIILLNAFNTLTQIFFPTSH
jgi:hypothetical protein